MTWWETDYTTFFNERTHNRVATWPLPGGARIPARFKMVGSEPSCASRASRHIFTWKPLPGGERYFSLIDVEPNGTPFELSGNTGEDPAGRVMELVITDYHLGNPHPEYSETGIGYKFVLTHPFKTTWTAEWFWPNPAIPPFESATVSLIAVPFAVPNARFINDDLGVDTAWESDVGSPIDWYTFSECSTPAGEEKEFVAGFAEFNGIDSYIALTSSLGSMNTPFVFKADIRRRGFNWIWCIFGKEGTGGFFGMDLSQVLFGNLTLDTSWTEVDDVWMEWEYHFEQDGQLRHQLFINGVEVMDQTTNRQFMNPNVLGVYRHNSFPTLWGHFDMKNLIYQKGTPGDFDIILDMPLIDNALDLGPLSNHGTTFNMELPSV